MNRTLECESVTNGNRPLPPRAQQPFAAIQVSLSQRHRFTERNGTSQRRNHPESTTIINGVF